MGGRNPTNTAIASQGWTVAGGRIQKPKLGLKQHVPILDDSILTTKPNTSSTHQTMNLDINGDNYEAQVGSYYPVLMSAKHLLSALSLSPHNNTTKQVQSSSLFGRWDVCYLLSTHTTPANHTR